MSKINNNVEIGKIQKVDSKTEKTENIEPQQKKEESSIKDFSNPKAEALGRSQVKSNDNLKADVAFGMAHPETIKNADKLFNIAFSGLQSGNNPDPDAYAKACAIATSGDSRELLSK